MSLFVVTFGDVVEQNWIEQTSNDKASGTLRTDPRCVAHAVRFLLALCADLHP